MSNENEPTSEPTSLSAPVRVAAGIVILASVISAVLVLVFASAPLRMNSVLVLIMLASSVFSAGGGLWMIGVTKNLLWALVLLPAIAMLILWFLIAQMAAVPFH